MQTHSIFNSDRYNQRISEMEFKPKLMLAKISEKYGYEDWLEMFKIEVKDIWAFYLFDENLTECWGDPHEYHIMGYVGTWYDYASLRIPAEAHADGFRLANGDLIDSEYNDDGEFRQDAWFEDQLQGTGDDSDGNAERSILIHDFATHEGEFSLQELGLDQDDIECLTAAEVMSKAFDAVVEYRNSWSDEKLFELFEKEAIAV